MPSDLALASDGRIARVVPQWSHEKLYYIERYLDIFCAGMRNRWSLVYCDLLSGPGLCIDRRSRQETPGSPLLALNRTEFRRLFLNDADPEVAAALSTRADSAGRLGVSVQALDCNDAVDPARRFLFPRGQSGGTLGLAVIDPTAFQMTFDGLRRLTDGVRMDLLIVFMSGFIHRFVREPEYEQVMDRFFGVPDWRELRRPGHRVQYRQLLDLYEQQLRGIGYSHIDDRVTVRNTNGSIIYHLLYASRHPLGAEFFGRISQRGPEGQRRLF